MPDKPTTAAGYPRDQAERVKATCLYLATKLGDLMDELVVVGGLVPSLIIDQEHLPENVTRHVGTLDLDLGLAFALVGGERYKEVAGRLREAGFQADTNDEGKTTRQRWRISEPPVTVDFLIEPEGVEGKPGSLFPLTKDWAAIIAPGLHLAFLDQQVVVIDGRTIAGEKATRKIRVCGAGAYVVLKALAFRIRGENKDAYDLSLAQLRKRCRGRFDAAEAAAPGPEHAGRDWLFEGGFSRSGGGGSKAGGDVSLRSARSGNPSRRRGVCSEPARRVVSMTVRGVGGGTSTSLERSHSLAARISRLAPPKYRPCRADGNFCRRRIDSCAKE